MTLMNNTPCSDPDCGYPNCTCYETKQRFSQANVIRLENELAELKNKPILKDHEIAQLVNELTATAVQYSGCQCMRAVLSAVVGKNLRKGNIY